MLRPLVLIILVMASFSAFAEDKKLGLENETALGYVVTGGNSQSETTSLNHKSVYNWSWDILQVTGHYIQSAGVVNKPTATNPNAQEKQVTAENWAATLRYEKVFTPKWFNGFLAHGWRGNKFQGVREGHDTDIGVKYFTANSETYQQFFEVGYRYTRELLLTAPAAIDRVGVGDLLHPEYHYARIFAQSDYKHSKTLTLGAWVEYLPSVTDFSKDQRLNYSPYLTSVLTDMFSLKVAYESRYRYKLAPGATKYTDYIFTTSLIAKF